METKETTIGQIQVTHDEMLSKIANVAEGQTLSWQQQKAEMEEHYAQLLAEIHARQKVLDLKHHRNYIRKIFFRG